MRCKKAGHSGPFEPGESAGLHISRFGVIPTRHQMGEIGSDIELSHPEGNYMNERIPLDLFFCCPIGTETTKKCSMHHASVR